MSEEGEGYGSFCSVERADELERAESDLWKTPPQCG